jgi:serine/threonine-protein kinase
MQFPEHTDALAGPADATINFRAAVHSARSSSRSRLSDIPHYLGRYRVLDEIARGGMGIVLRVYDPELDRELAVKLLSLDIEPDSETGRRFAQEPRVMSQLYHPGIIPVFEASTLPDGRPYFAMPLVRGKTLTRLLDVRGEPDQDLSWWLLIFQQLCAAMAHAHSQRIVHRDLKPANVMIGEFGEVVVMDWGVAAMLDARAWSATNGGGCWVFGTPAYMAPEQARGTAAADPRGDVFGLGAILCEILTCQPPYVGPDVATVTRLAMAGDQKEMNGRLEACVADAAIIELARQCLSPDAADRPADAGEVAQTIDELMLFASARSSYRSTLGRRGITPIEAADLIRS